MRAHESCCFFSTFAQTLCFWSQMILAVVPLSNLTYGFCITNAKQCIPRWSKKKRLEVSLVHATSVSNTLVNGQNMKSALQRSVRH